jgi:hypothetical protein
MKIVYSLLFFFYSIVFFAQDRFKFTPELRFYATSEMGLGSNQLKKAHGTAFGGGVEMAFISYKKVKASLGLQYTKFPVRDNERIGSYTSTRFYDIFFQLAYELKPFGKVKVTPLVQLSGSSLRQLTSNSVYNTNEITSKINPNIGVMINYAIGNNFDVYLKTMYVTRTFSIKTNPEYEEFFNKNESLAFNFGVTIILFPNSSKTK